MFILHNIFLISCAVAYTNNVQTGGVTLTLGVAYLTVLAHERNRQAQAQQLRSQSRVLTSLLEPTPISPPQTRAELAREERGTLIETAKDRWNEEVESAVRWVQRTEWNDVRENLEGTVSRLLNGQKGQQMVEEVSSIASAAKAKAQETAASARESTGRIGEAAKIKAHETAVSTKEGTSRIGEIARAKSEQATSLAKQNLNTAEISAAELRDAAKAKATWVGADAKSEAHQVAESIRGRGGTVDAARGAVRDAISKGIEKGKEAIGM